MMASFIFHGCMDCTEIREEREKRTCGCRFKMGAGEARPKLFAQQKTSLSAKRKSSFSEGKHHAPQARITSEFGEEKFRLVLLLHGKP